MALFIKYLKYHYKSILLYIGTVTVFAAVSALFRAPAEATLYAVLLSAVFAAALLLHGFERVKKRHDQMKTVNKVTEQIPCGIPKPNTIEGEDYYAILTGLNDEMLRMRTDDSVRYNDMIDYYTVWAHQIKTPIASMKLMIKDEDMPLARNIGVELFKIEQYVEMVLAFLRLDSVSHDYVFREYCLDDIVRQALHKFAPEFINRKIRLEYIPLEKRVITDEKWLSFVVEQVISNALKYSRGGKIKIYRRGENMICIEDNGIGISPDDLPRIFEKGYTGYNGRADKSASGIGLYLCRRICGNLGIGISAESKLDEGTALLLDFGQKNALNVRS